MGLMATMLPGVRPSISFASLPTASTSPVFLLMATIDGSLTTMPLPRAYTRVFAVPRSMARSLEKMLKRDRRLCVRDPLEWNPFFDMIKFFPRFSSMLPLRENPASPRSCFHGGIHPFYEMFPHRAHPRVLALSPTG